MAAQTVLRVAFQSEETDGGPGLTPGLISVIKLGSIDAIARRDWQRMLPTEPESWDFYVAAERSPPAGVTRSL